MVQGFKDIVVNIEVLKSKFAFASLKHLVGQYVRLHNKDYYIIIRFSNKSKLKTSK